MHLECQRRTNRSTSTVISFEPNPDVPTTPFVRGPAPTPTTSVRAPRLGRLAWYTIVCLLTGYVAFVTVLILAEVLT
jgi:hypothetical protein